MDRSDCAPGVFGASQFAGAELGDARRTRRLMRMADQMLMRPEGTLPHKITDPYQLEAAYRFFAEPEVTHGAILAPHCRHVRQEMVAASEVVLIAHDGTEFNFSTLDIPDLGVLAGPKGRGFLCHNSLALTASGRVFGLANQILFRPQPAPATDTKSKARRNPDKISTLWRNAVAEIGPTPAGSRWVHLADRGADVTEFLDYMDEDGMAYVVRAQHDRNIEWTAGGQKETGYLFEYLRTLPAITTREQDVAQQAGRSARTATVALAFAGVTIQSPRQARGRERGVPLELTAIRIWEPQPPGGTPALEWFLLTNVTCETAADGWERADWYARRWGVEEYHKAQKTGVGIETLQLTTVSSLEAAIAVLSVVAVALLVMRDAARRDDAATTPARTIVPAAWVELVSRWRYNENRDLSIRDWLLALGRMGGHQNRPSDGMPGWQTIWRGWRQLHAMLAAWRIMQQPP